MISTQCNLAVVTITAEHKKAEAYGFALNCLSPLIRDNVYRNLHMIRAVDDVRIIMMTNWDSLYHLYR